MTTSRRGVTPWIAVLAISLALYLAGCGGSSADLVDPVVEPSAAEVGGPIGPSTNPELLSDWGQLDVRDGQLVLGADVVAYTLNTPLFSDYAHKLRTVWLPDGSEPAGYHNDDVFAFPVGTVITKTFYFPVAGDAEQDPSRVARSEPDADVLAQPLDIGSVRLIETRVLVHREDGWAALPYVWNEDQSDATLARVGDLIMLTLVDQAGADAASGENETAFPYVVPNVNQCANCHAVNHTTGVIQPIGPKARHLNQQVALADGVVSQLDHWQDRGLLADGAVPANAPASAVWMDDAASLDERARAYLDINCAHCHNSVGPADTSGLFLEPSTDLGSALGICKLPIAAGTGTGGRQVGIHPGDADLSIFVYRMETTDPSAMMPELGRAVTHSEGVDLISSWINQLDGDC